MGSRSTPVNQGGGQSTRTSHQLTRVVGAPNARSARMLIALPMSRVTVEYKRVTVAYKRMPSYHKRYASTKALGLTPKGVLD